uniref:Uncharacterized protein n=1 Tax=Helianthus annuus TaxID=4232 RepID=A0A251S1R1_HELAN
MHGESLWFCKITPIIPIFWKLHRCSLWFDNLLLGYPTPSSFQSHPTPAITTVRRRFHISIPYFSPVTIFNNTLFISQSIYCSALHIQSKEMMHRTYQDILRRTCALVT